MRESIAGLAATAGLLIVSFAKTKNAFEMISMRSACNIVTRTKFQGVAEFWRTTTPKNRAGAWTPARALPQLAVGVHLRK